jgi:predicted nucleotidyltransferase
VPQLTNDIRALLEIMIKHGVEFAICGGHAVAYHGYPRMTMDVDILILPSDENAERIMAVLEEFGFGKAGVPRQAFTREGTAITLGEQPNQADLLTSMSSTPTEEVLKHAVWGKLGGLEVRFVSRSDLIEAKRQARRPKDLADLDELKRADT